MKRLLCVTIALVLALGLCPAAMAEETQSSNAVIWCFAETHANYFRWVTEEYTKQHPELTFTVEIMDNTSMQDRLSVIINAGGEGSPDLVDIEQGTFPRYMNEDMMHFVPLDEYITRDGLENAMVEARLSLYTYGDKKYGLEHALCPVTMAYNPTLFEQCGIEVPTTWQEFKDAAAKFKEQGIYICVNGDMRTGDMGYVELLARAAGKDIVADDGSLQITDEWKMLVSDTAQMQNDGMIYAAETDEDKWLQFRENRVAVDLEADWAAGWLRDNVPEQSGQWRMTYLPKVTEDASRTSVNGGTGLCMMEFTQNDREALWNFMKFAMYDTDNCLKKYEMVNLYPPVYAAMEGANTPVEYFGGQNLGELYQELAGETPVQKQAAWRTVYSEVLKNYLYDFVEGNMTIDELADSVVSEVASRTAQ